MSKIIIFILVTILIFLTSCSTYEENITFFSDGKILYELAIISSVEKGGNKTEPTSESNRDKNWRKNIVFTDFYKQEIQKDEQRPIKAQEEELLLALEPIIYDQSVNGDTIKISGLFDNAEKLNKALYSLTQLVLTDFQKTDSIEDTPLGLPLEIVSYSWNGNKLDVYIPAFEEGGYDEKETKDSSDKKNKIFYHFPNKVTSVNDTDFVLSKDKKTVTLTYGYDFYLPMKARSVTIETE